MAHLQRDTGASTIDLKHLNFPNNHTAQQQLEGLKSFLHNVPGVTHAIYLLDSGENIRRYLNAKAKFTLSNLPANAPAAGKTFSTILYPFDLPFNSILSSRAQDINYLKYHNVELLDANLNPIESGSRTAMEGLSYECFFPLCPFLMACFVLCIVYGVYKFSTLLLRFIRSSEKSKEPSSYEKNFNAICSIVSFSGFLDFIYFISLLLTAYHYNGSGFYDVGVDTFVRYFRDRFILGLLCSYILLNLKRKEFNYRLFMIGSGIAVLAKIFTTRYLSQVYVLLNIINTAQISIIIGGSALCYLLYFFGFLIANGRDEVRDMWRLPSERRYDKGKEAFTGEEEYTKSASKTK